VFFCPESGTIEPVRRKLIDADPLAGWFSNTHAQRQLDMARPWTRRTRRT
jgi:hypothetical protein